MRICKKSFMERMKVFLYLCNDKKLMGPTGFDIRMNGCVSMQSVVNAALKSQFSAVTGDYDYALAA